MTKTYWLGTPAIDMIKEEKMKYRIGQIGTALRMGQRRAVAEIIVDGTEDQFKKLEEKIWGCGY